MEQKKEMNRRKFIKLLSGGTLATAAALAGCESKSVSEKIGTASTRTGDVPTDKMTCRENRHGDKVSILGYGCMRWPTKPTADGKDEELDQETINKLVDYALAHGVNYFDTSPAYCQGKSEEATGIALHRHPRESYYVATKLSNFDPSTHSREASMEMYRNSFKYLQVDYIDYYLLHGIGMGGMEAFRARYIDNGMLDFLLEERKAGRIRNLGWSYHGDVEVFDYLLSLDIQWDFAQIQLNYVDWKHASGRNTNAEYLYNELNKRGVPAVIMEPLLGGRLAQIPTQCMESLQQLRPGWGTASWAFRFAGTPKHVLTVLSGMTYMEHLQDNIRSFAPLEPCNEKELAALEDAAEIISKYSLVPCTACQYCMPCPYGLDIPAIFKHYNKCLNEGFVPKSLQDEHYARDRRVFLIGYDRSVPKLRQANHCVGCNKCVEHCPQNIRIPQEMQRIDEFVEKLKQGLEI